MMMLLVPVPKARFPSLSYAVLPEPSLPGLPPTRGEGHVMPTMPDAGLIGAERVPHGAPTCFAVGCTDVTDV